MRPFLRLVARFGRDESGVFAIMFGLMAVVLIAMGGAVVDYVRLEQTRNRAQIALDAAALALQKQITDESVDEETLKAKAQGLLTDRVADTTITANVLTATISRDDGTLLLTADMEVPTLFVGLVGVHQLGAHISSQVKGGSTNVEVSVVIDLTGSMGQYIASGSGGKQQTKVQALSTALQQLIPAVVQDRQTPTYSKMAIVPYSMGVNVGAYATSIRGSITGPTAITNVAWARGVALTIAGATKANPVVVTSKNHGFLNGDSVYIETNAYEGMTQIHKKVFVVADAKTDTFQLKDTDGRWYNTFKSGTVTRCLVANCEMVATSANHGLATNDNVYISGVSGLSVNNGQDYSWGSGFGSVVWPVGTVSGSNFVLTGSSRANVNGAYKSGGSAQCVKAGCEWFYFINPAGDARRQQVSTCVTERTANAYTNEPPSTTLLGRNYPNSSNPCLSNTIVPLTHDKTVLTNLAKTLTAGGSTGGHIGVAWGWYLVSPKFNGPWPAASQPAPASEENIFRAVVLMTDGEFNSGYCDGVISQDSTSGSGDPAYHISCNAPNGGSYAQTQALCNAMKADTRLRVYTVGFDIVDSPNARALMANCASAPEYAHTADTASELSAAFRKIGESIGSLRVTQ